MDPDEFDLMRPYWRSSGVLLILGKLGRSAGETEISALSGIGGKAVRRHLRSLEQGGLVIRHHKHNGYALSRLGKLFLTSVSGQKAHNSVRSDRISGHNERFWRSTTSSAFNSRKIENREAEGEEGAKTGQNERNSVRSERIAGQIDRFDRSFLHRHSIWRKRNHLSGARAAQAISALQAANLAALRAEGLGSNHRVQRVSRLPHVTPEYIAGQARRLRQENRFAATLLLHIVESGDPLPNEPDPGAAEARERQRYYSGPYADIIEH